MLYFVHSCLLKGTLLCHPLPFLWPLTLEDLGLQSDWLHLWVIHILYIAGVDPHRICNLWLFFVLALLLSAGVVKSLGTKVEGPTFFFPEFLFIQHLDAHRNIYTKLVLVIIAYVSLQLDAGSLVSGHCVVITSFNDLVLLFLHLAWTFKHLVFCVLNFFFFMGKCLVCKHK